MKDLSTPYPWTDVAHHWRFFGPPLRPCSEDIAIMESAVRNHARRANDEELQALLLGVTPEIASMKWPKKTSLLAIDKSESMIDIVWPGDVPGVRRAQVGNWNTLPVEPASRDVVIGDGCFLLLGYPDNQLHLASLLRQILRPHGVFIVRLFVQSEPAESVDNVFGDVAAGAIGSFHVFKWRLAMALQDDPRTGVKLDDIWQVWSESICKVDRLSDRVGWTTEAVSTIERYKGSDARLTFPALSQYQQVLTKSFEELETHIPHYELGERCPTLVLVLRN